MKLSFIKRITYVAMIVVGIIDLIYFLFHDKIEAKIPYYGFNDKIAIVLGISFVLIGSLLFMLEKSSIESSSFFSAKINLLESSLLMVLIAIVFGAGGMAYSYNKFVLKGSGNKGFAIGIYYAYGEDPFEFTGDGVENPVLTRNDVTDIDATIVADPFLIYEDSTFYLFFEALDSYTAQGDIGLATSKDGVQWSYEKIVLDERFHLSYPFVFKWQEDYYMIPETASTREVRLYKAEEFPYKWTYIKTLLNDKLFKDTTLFYYNKLWWLFTETFGNSFLRLYYAETPLGPWTEHPKSPVVSGNPNIARPGGNVVVYDDRIVRFAQDDDPYYGNQVWAFEITRLTTKDYDEKKVNKKPTLKGKDYWNKRGMHQISSIKLGPNKWIAAVDGY